MKITLPVSILLQLQLAAQFLAPILTHLGLLHLYLTTIHTNFQPEINAGRTTKNEPVLDEIGIFLNNRDTRGVSTITEVFQNDYWGHDIRGLVTNKSWRPFTVLTFRWVQAYLKDHNLEIEIMIQRLINAVIHVCNAELVSRIGIALVSFDANDQARNLILQIMIKLIFGLHPIAPEVAVNGANRAHGIGLLCSLIACLIIMKTDVVQSRGKSQSSANTMSALVMLFLIWAIGLMSCESIVFQVPAVFITCFVVHWRRVYQISGSYGNKSVHTMGFISKSILAHLPCFVIVLGLTLAYIGGRFILGIEAIDPDLFTSSQHPFHHLSGLNRLVNFTYTTCIHILKSCFLDPIGKL